MQNAPFSPGPVRIDDVEEFVNRGVDALPRLFGASAHVRAVQLVQDGELPEHVAAAYTAEHGGVVMWQRRAAQLAQHFMDGDYRCGHPRDELAFLAHFKGELTVLFHEAVYSLGPQEWETFGSDFVRDVRDQGATAAKEGLTELIAERFLDRWIVAMGLDRFDPRLLQVRATDMGAYPGQVTAMEELVNDVARARGLSSDDVLRQVVRDGCGGRAHDRLLQVALGARGVPVTADTMRSAHLMLRQTLYRCRQEFDQVLATPSSFAGDTQAMIQQLRDRGHLHGRRLLADLGGVQRSRVSHDPWRLVVLPQRPRVVAPQAWGAMRCATHSTVARELA